LAEPFVIFSIRSLKRVASLVLDRRRRPRLKSRFAFRKSRWDSRLQSAQLLQTAAAPAGGDLRLLQPVQRSKASVKHLVFARLASGEVSEWLKVPLSKSGVVMSHRGFESRPLRRFT